MFQRIFKLTAVNAKRMIRAEAYRAVTYVQ